ncbi:SurA N-terminal domain-containing protein [Mesorhizobium sp. CAU 1741]|uniref:SurA N-terminal domain-containing protein n=1 Tax=Mesorhizobium sp. CAU 1741 TaxID=3140366 RepID=UPI00325B0D6D
MLNSLRNAARSWVSKVLLVLLVLSFAIWGISGQIFGGLGSNVLAVGDTRVSVMDYRLAYDRQIAQLSQQFGTSITREQAQAFGVDNQVLAQLVAGAVLDEQAREMRLGLSEDRLASLTAEDPAFHGPDGRFDRNQFDWVLQQVGMRPDDYLRNRQQVAVRQQIVEAVSDGLDAPDAFLRAVALHGGEDRTVEFVVLPPSLVEPIEAPSEEQVAQWFEEHRSDYAAPEYRQIQYVKLEPEDIADPSAVSEEQARQEYDRTIERYTTGERRRIEQIVFADTEAASAALDRIRSGASFEDVVAEEGKQMSDVLLGTFEKERVADPAIAEAAFALEEGAVSDVVEGTFGPILLRVTEITPETVRPFEMVSQEIREAIAIDEAHRLVTNVYDAYEDARASGDTMQAAADSQRLEVVTVEAVDRSGRNPEGTILTDLPESRLLLQEAFETEQGIENPPLNLGSTGYLFYEVTQVDAARDRELDEVRERVVEDWTANERSTRLSERAAEIEQRLADGTPFSELAEELDVELQTKRGLTRDANDADLGTAAVAAAFGVARGETGVAPAPDDTSQIVFRVAEVIQPAGAGPDAVPEETRDAMASGISDDLLDQLVARLQSQYEVTVDRNAIQQALSF